MRSDEFRKSVTETDGPGDPEIAAVVTRTVLDNLGKQLKGVEAADLAAQLPAELHEPMLLATPTIPRESSPRSSRNGG